MIFPLHVSYERDKKYTVSNVIDISFSKKIRFVIDILQLCLDAPGVRLDLSYGLFSDCMHYPRVSKSHSPDFMFIQSQRH